MRYAIMRALGLAAVVAMSTSIVQAADILPSWNDGPAKKALVDFVTKVTKDGGPDFVPPPERIPTLRRRSYRVFEPLPVSSGLIAKSHFKGIRT
jgi:hypothetical protein